MVLFDFFLEKLSSSNYHQNFILKGGFLIASLINLDLRTTKDLDITIRSLSLDKRTIHRVIEEILSVTTITGLVMRLVDLTIIQDEALYSGLRATISVELDGLKDTIKIDLTTGDMITPSEINYQYRTLLDNKLLNLKAYNIETILAEKLETILVRAQVNTRMRDYYDVYVLWMRYAEKISLAYLKEGFTKTANARESWPVIQNNWVKTINVIKVDQQLIKLWSRYQLNYPFAKDINWNHMIEIIDHILNKILLNP
jgi:predicted nucleotidyltransferase component of viral defense system